MNNIIDQHTTPEDREAAAKALGYRDWDDANDYRLTRSEDDAVRKMVRSFTEHRLNSIKAHTAAIETTANTLRDALSELLGSEFVGVYDCGRVWEAWSVGTMSKDDFTEANDRLDDIVDGVMAVIAKHIPVGENGLLKAHFTAAVDALMIYDPAIGQAMRANYAHYSGQKQ